MHLEKPYPKMPAFKIIPRALERIRRNRCPICNKIVNTDETFSELFDPDDISSPFRDDLSRKEYSMSGLCQDCQDKAFGVDEDV